MDDIKFLVGNQDNFIQMCEEDAGILYEPYDEQVINFLHALSRKIMKDNEAKQYPDVVSLGFYLRSANLNRLKEEAKMNEIRMGRGMIFHVAPSNVPVNAFFSLTFGLLAGNVNVLRVPTKEFGQITCVCRLMRELLEREYSFLAYNVAVVSYERNSSWSAYLSEHCCGRVIWGGDETIASFAPLKMHPRAVEIHFADRYSFAVLSAKAVLGADDKQTQSLAEGFYNDTYLMDQNACSSPHLICWKSDCDAMEDAKDKFWNAVYETAKKYDLADIKCTGKYTTHTENVMRYPQITSVKRYDNLLYVSQLSKVPDSLEQLRGKFGDFYEIEIEDLGELGEALTQRTQSCLYFGLEPRQIYQELTSRKRKGVDRIVPIGKALDITVYWDGYDIIRELSRIITLE
ncbi:MAG: hypothetical protein K6G01_10690 [Eubacterium sp.]|nr:hypothetical protein [Eubacterium sp.]